MGRISFLTEKSIVVDDVLAKLLGSSKGELVSYTELTKGLHSYIKANGLRVKDATTTVASASVPESAPAPVSCSAPAPIQQVVPDVEWPRRCQRCYDQLVNLEKLKSHFKEFHGESLAGLNLHQFIIENSFKTKEAD